MEIFGGCHQGKEQQLHIRMTVLWSPVGKAKVSRAPDFSFLIISEASYGSTNSPSEFWPLLAPRPRDWATPRAWMVGRDLSTRSCPMLPRFQS